MSISLLSSLKNMTLEIKTGKSKSSLENSTLDPIKIGCSVIMNLWLILTIDLSSKILKNKSSIRKRY